MDVTVITKEPMNFGHGPDTRIVFADAKYHAEPEKEGGRLSVQSELESITGNVATFQPSEWRCVIRGDVVGYPDSDSETGYGAPIPPPSMVRSQRTGANAGANL